MTRRTVIILWTVAAALSAVATLAVRTTSATHQARSMVMPDAPAPGELKAMTLDRGDATWRFERDEMGQWWQEEPFRHRMETQALMAIPETLGRLERVARVPVDAAQAALLRVDDAAALATLVLEPREGAPVTIRLGRTGIGGRAWLRIGEDTEVFAVDTDLHAMAVHEAPQVWRDARLVPTAGPTTLQIRRDVGDEVVELARSGLDWSFVSPVATRADNEQVTEHVGAVAAAAFSAVLLDDPADISAFGLVPPFAEIRVADDTGVTTLLLGDRVSGSTADRYAMVQGTPSIVRLPGDHVQAILADAVQLVDRTGSGVEAPDVRSMRIVTEAGTLEIERDLDRWRVVDGVLLETEAVDALLHVLTRELAPEVELLPAYPSQLEVATIVLQGGGGRPLDTVRVLREPPPPAGSGRWGLENGDGVLRILPAGTHVPLRFESLARPSDVPVNN